MRLRLYMWNKTVEISEKSGSFFSERDEGFSETVKCRHWHLQPAHIIDGRGSSGLRVRPKGLTQSR